MKTMATIMMEYFEITIEKDIAYAYDYNTNAPRIFPEYLFSRFPAPRSTALDLPPRPRLSLFTVSFCTKA